MAFNAEDFMESPDQDIFDSLVKDDLLVLADYLELSVKKSWRKIDIQRVIVKHLISAGLFDESSLSSYCTASEIEMKKIEVQKQIDLKKIEQEKELKKLEIEERKLELDRERERDEHRRLEIEKEKEIELKKLELQGRSTSHQSTDRFDITKHIRLVPPFKEDDIDKYFLHFEKIAENLKWPKEYWCMLLQSVFVGKAREIYSQLSVTQASDYDLVKDLILKGYELVPEAYRQKFRNCQKETNQTYVEFARSKEQLFDRWCVSKKVGQNYDHLRQLILIEEFKRCIRQDIRVFLDEQKADTLENASRLADDYSLTHKISFVNKP